MDFRVSINDEVRIFEQYRDALQWIDNRMAYWNNFDAPIIPLHIKVTKIPSDTGTIGINASNYINLSERLS